MSKEMGDNSHGFKNEENIVSALNGKKYKELNLNMKKFVDYICECEGFQITLETEVKSHIETNNKKKQDLYVEIMEKTLGVSVKMGSGNSTHQEKCEDFIDYIVSEYDASNEICDDIRIFTWCDGTLDGSGNVSDRLNKKQYLSFYAKGISRIRGFIKEHERELIDRILFVGRYNSKVDYIYHGTAVSGKWISAKELIEYQISNPQPLGSSLAKIGRMNLQVWNRSLTGKSDNKRGQLQIKYSSMEEDLDKIMHANGRRVGTFEGDQEEFNISKVMNKNKVSTLWREMGYRNHNENLYMIKVSYNAFSKLANKKVKAKADAYIVETELSDKFLLEREYIISEMDLEGFNYKVILGTGISVKKKDSNKFTYEKLSLNSFIRLFNGYISDPKICFLALTLYQEEKNIHLNQKIIEDLGYTLDEVLIEISKYTGLDSPSVYLKEDIKAFRTYHENKLREVISQNVEVREMIFTGKGCFDAPYYVDYIYKNGSLSKDIIPNNYQITNGSGRSKGKYTIIFKPLK